MRYYLFASLGFALAFSAAANAANPKELFSRTVGTLHGKSLEPSSYCSLSFQEKEDSESELIYTYGDYQASEQVKISSIASDFRWSNRKMRFQQSVKINDQKMSLEVFANENMEAEKILLTDRRGKEESICYLQPFLDKQQEKYLFFDQNFESYTGLDEESGKTCTADFEADNRKSVKISFYDRLKKELSFVKVAKTDFILDQWDLVTSFRDGFKLNKTFISMTSSDLYVLGKVTIEDRGLVFGESVRAECFFEL